MTMEARCSKVGSWIGKKLDRVGRHVKRHKKAYIGVAVGVAALAAKAYVDKKNNDEDDLVWQQLPEPDEDIEEGEEEDEGIDEGPEE